MNPQCLRTVSLALLFLLGISVHVDGFAARDHGVSALTDNTTSSLSVELRVDWNGVVRPAAKMKVVLLDADPEIILRDAGLEATPGADLVSTYEFALTGTGTRAPRLKQFRVDADKAMKPHILATGVTDEQGMVHFAGLKPGPIYLRGSVKIDRGRSFVQSSFELKPGANTLILGGNDQSKTP